MLVFFFFFNDTATTEIYTLSLHDALPIFTWGLRDEHDAVDDKRCGLGAVELWDVVGPLQLEFRHIAAIDLVEGAEEIGRAHV